MLAYIITHKYHIVFANITFNQGCQQYTDIDSGKSKQTHESPDKTIPYIIYHFTIMCALMHHVSHGLGTEE